jgi:CHAD domain-containing protein
MSAVTGDETEHGADELDLAQQTIELDVLYYDTPDHLLLSSEVTLRREVGGPDAGWRLGIGGATTRAETDADDVPPALTSALVGVAAGQPLRQVARLHIHRQVNQLRTPTGVLIAELSDDTVSAESLGPPSGSTAWHQTDITLGPGADKKTLAGLRQRLDKAGVAPIAHPAQVARALGVVAHKSPPGSSGRALLAYLHEQHRVLIAGDLVLREGEVSDEDIHGTRVAARRYRSTLRTFVKYFEADAAGYLERELSWFAGLLGQVRDRDVQGQMLLDGVGQLPDDIVLGPVRARIRQEMAGERAAHLGQLREEMSGERYFALLRTLAAWHDAPPLTRKAERGVKHLHRAGRRAHRQTVAKLSQALDLPENTSEPEMHRARKAAKRDRYAIELTGASKHTERALKQLQDIMGDYQDSVVSAEVLRHLGATAGVRPDENGFTFGILFEQARAKERQARADARAWLAQNG